VGVHLAATLTFTFVFWFCFIFLWLFFTSYLFRFSNPKSMEFSFSLNKQNTKFFRCKCEKFSLRFFSNQNEHHPDTARGIRMRIWPKVQFQPSHIRRPSTGHLGKYSSTLHSLYVTHIFKDTVKQKLWNAHMHFQPYWRTVEIIITCCSIIYFELV
jgi:hypothetical protein